MKLLLILGYVFLGCQTKPYSTFHCPKERYNPSFEEQDISTDIILATTSDVDESDASGDTSSQPKLTLKLMTLNLDRNQNDWDLRMPLIIQQIREESPDIIVFQEVYPPYHQPCMIANALAESALSYYIVENHLVGAFTESEGLAILSRYLPDQYGWIDLKAEGLILQWLQLSISGEPVLIYNLKLHEETTADQSEALIDAIETMVANPLNTITLLAASLYREPTSPDFSAISKDFNDLWKTTKPGEPALTYPTPMTGESARFMYDYLFLKKDIEDVRVVIDRIDIAFTQQSAIYPKIFASTHFGLEVQFSVY